VGSHVQPRVGVLDAADVRRRAQAEIRLSPRSEGAATVDDPCVKWWSRHSDLNRGPAVYETALSGWASEHYFVRGGFEIGGSDWGFVACRWACSAQGQISNPRCSDLRRHLRVSANAKHPSNLRVAPHHLRGSNLSTHDGARLSDRSGMARCVSAKVGAELGWKSAIGGRSPPPTARDCHRGRLGACVGNGNQRNRLPLTPRNGADIARLSPLVPRNRL
jgi:hypothetical protein